MQRHISHTDLTTITAPEVVALGLTLNDYNWLITKRDALLDLLLHAPSNSPESTALIELLSTIAQTIYAYEELHHLERAA